MYVFPVSGVRTRWNNSRLQENMQSGKIVCGCCCVRDVSTLAVVKPKHAGELGTPQPHTAPDLKADHYERRLTIMPRPFVMCI